MVSEWINILSEFRIFVLHDRVISIQPYLGMPLMFPNANKIRKMITKKIQRDGSESDVND